MARKIIRNSQLIGSGPKASAAASDISGRSIGSSTRDSAEQDVLSPDEIEAAAASWIARLDSELATVADREAFHSWCEISPEHRLAADRMLNLFSEMSRIRRPR